MRPHSFNHLDPFYCKAIQSASAIARPALVISHPILHSSMMTVPAVCIRTSQGHHRLTAVVRLLLGAWLLLTAQASAVPPIQRRHSPRMEGLKNSLASALAAGCSKTLLAPFDTLKTIQQHSQGGGALSFRDACRIVLARPNGFLEFYVRLCCLEHDKYSVHN